MDIGKLQQRWACPPDAHQSAAPYL
jgi:hypothetical protein